VIEQQLHPLVTRLRTILGEYLGVEMAPPAAPAPEAPPHEAPARIIVAEAPAAEVPRLTPTVDPVRALLEQLIRVFTTGIRLARYREHKFVVAPELITYEGNVHDLGDEYDTVILVPTIDAQIEIDRAVDVASTPVIKAFTSLNLDSVKVRRIYYKGVTPGLTGTMNIWAFKY
jgi:hypothetical protein